MTEPSPQPFALYNTAARAREPFRPADPSHVTFYSCGPTVYDDAHIGNFRSFLAADLLRRWLESPLCALENDDGNVHAGPRRVTHVMNITDVGHMTDDDQADGGGEDKMALAEQRLLEAKKAGTVHADAVKDPKDPKQIADFYAERFLDDARKLGLKVAVEASKSAKDRQRLMPRATEHVPGMKRIIGSLLERGDAYAAGEPGKRAVYFDVQKCAHYGELSGNTLDKLRGGAGGRVGEATQSEKHHPADFLLWKEDDTHVMKWASDDIHASLEGWGPGYPGWHIECSAMSLAQLVPGGLEAAAARHREIDLHSGGEDNIFPHHECEIAQSCAFTGAPRFARHWFHARFLMVEGQKMSKSKGTFYTARDLFEKGIEPAALRLALIGGHYRSNIDFSMQALKDAQRTITRWRTFLDNAGSDNANAAHESDPDARAVAVTEFARSMADDLNVAGAIAAMNTWVASTPEPGEPDAELMRTFDAVLGVLELERPESAEFEIGVFLPGVEPDAAVESLLLERRDAKKAKDFARADAIRDELAGRGLAIKDVAGGRVEVGPV